MDHAKFARLVEEAGCVTTTDKMRLDEEWLEQPRTYFRFAEALAEAQEDLATAKLELKLKDNELKERDAELDLDIRRDPGKYKLEGKLTEPMIAHCVVTQPEHRKAQLGCYDAEREVLKARKMVDTLEAACKALDHKKKALEDLCYLDGRNYYSGPRQSGETGERMRRKEAENAFRHPSKGGQS